MSEGTRAPSFQVPGREMALDPVLTPEQPVHGTVELILTCVLDAEFLAERVGERLGSETTGGGQLGAGFQDPGEDHGGRQRPLAGASLVEELLEAQTAGGAEDGGRRGRGAGSGGWSHLRRRRRGRGARHRPLDEQDAQPLDQLVGPLGEVGEGAFLDFAVLAEGLAQEYGGG